MAQENSEASVASSSPAVNWWDLGTNSFVPWNAMNHARWTQHTNSSNLCEENLSISTNSFTNPSGLSNQTSSAAAADHHTDNHIWNQVLLGKNLTTHMFNPVCDYLKKLDSSNWEFSNSYNGGDLIDSERLTSNLSDLVSNWSIAPPNPHVDHQQIVSMDPNAMAYTSSHVSHMKHENSGSASIPNFQSYVQHELGDFSFGLNNSVIGLNNSGLMADGPWSIPRNLSDLISFGSLNNACMKSSVSSESSKKTGLEQYSSTKGSGRCSGTTSEGKKKRTDQYSSETLFKKPKNEGSSQSPIKLQVPKVKVADKITTLQQIVSPFGKTDTASVLLEAINYIRFLQEQVQLLSDPYLKSSTNKDHSSWGNMERKEKVESKLDLRSRGLCLVPISCTPQAYRENNGPDYWTPPYRGCLYR